MVDITITPLLEPGRADVSFGHGSGEYVRFRVEAQGRPSWIAAVPSAGWHRWGFVRQFHESPVTLLCVGGVGYVVDTVERALRYRTSAECLFEAQVIPGRDLIIAASPNALYALSSHSECWRCDDLDSDGIVLVEVKVDQVTGYMWFPHDGWHSFALFLEPFTLSVDAVGTKEEQNVSDPAVDGPRDGFVISSSAPAKRTGRQPGGAPNYVGDLWDRLIGRWNREDAV